MDSKKRTSDPLLSLIKSLAKTPDNFPVGPCPDESLLANYFQGGCLQEEDEKSIQSHLADCVICRETLIACAMSLSKETKKEVLPKTSNPSDVLEEELKTMEESLQLGDNPQEHNEASAEILVVDDDPIYLRAITDILSDDFDVTACSNGDSAICNVRRRRFHAIVLDIKMAGINGLEVARTLKADLIRAPIIFNTGFPGEFFKEDIEKNFCPFGYVTKDNPAELLTLVRQAALPQAQI